MSHIKKPRNGLLSLLYANNEVQHQYNKLENLLFLFVQTSKTEVRKQREGRHFQLCATRAYYCGFCDIQG